MRHNRALLGAMSLRAWSNLIGHLLLTTSEARPEEASVWQRPPRFTTTS
jgi:hypothetical protein